MKIIPNLWFDNQAEEAADFYVSLFENSRIKNKAYYDAESSKVSGMTAGTLMTVEFELAGQMFININGGPVFSFTPATSFLVSCKTSNEVEKLYSKLSENGNVLMPLDSYEFSEKYAWVNDRFGVSWQLLLGTREQKITPCLLFVQKQYGKAKQAIDFYVSIFDDSKIKEVVTYRQDENEKEGAVKFAEFIINGQQFTAMDSGRDHKFTFTPAVSFMVECENQNQIDHLWNNLSAVPQAEQCGWLQDKYGVSWQIVPAILAQMILDKDSERSARVRKSFYQMKKIDIDELLKAYEQK